MVIEKLFLIYWKIDKNIEFNQTKGSVIEITPKQPGSINKDFGITKIPVDKELFQKFMTGNYKIDVENTTFDEYVIDYSHDKYRMEATNFIIMSKKDLVSSSYYKKLGETKVYEEYIKKYLEEFTSCTKHIPFDEKLKIYPLALLTPCKINILIAKDGVIFDFNSETRPETNNVQIDLDKILDELLLPHPSGKIYSSYGPNRISNWICSDKNCVYIKGDGNYNDISMLGNPIFVVFEASYHSYIYNMNLVRNYPSDSTQIKKYIEFAEIFGDYSEENFTLDKAIIRAREFAHAQILSSFRNENNGKLKLNDIKNNLSKFEDLISKNTKEDVIEEFIDKNSWIIERGLGYKKYHSQINIPDKFLSYAEAGIKPDKYIENNDGYCDIIDLKKSDMQILIKKKNRNRASYILTEAESQIDKYIELSMQPKVRKYLESKSINIYRPNGIVIVGRTPKNDIDKWIEIKSRLKISAVTYDDLVNGIKEIINWIDNIKI